MDTAYKIRALEREVRELRQANEVLRKGSAYFGPFMFLPEAQSPAQGVAQFIGEHRKTLEVEPTYKVMPIVPPAYYAV